MTGTSIERATRSAVRCRVPVSDVGTLGLGTRWTLARAMRLASAARMMAPSIFASSDSRCGLKAASSRKPPEQMLSTSGPSPTTMSAPMLACRMRSRPSRSGVPGATAASASMSWALGRETTAQAYCGRRTSPRGDDVPRRPTLHGVQAQRVAVQRLAERRHPRQAHAVGRVGRRARARSPARSRAGPPRPGGARCGGPGAARRRGRPRRRPRGRPAAGGPWPTRRRPAPWPGRRPARPPGRRRPPPRGRRPSPRSSSARLCSTASTWARRPASSPWAERRGRLGVVPGSTSACTSTSSGR